jgi:hypothetical protein
MLLSQDVTPENVGWCHVCSRSDFAQFVHWKDPLSIGLIKPEKRYTISLFHREESRRTRKWSPSSARWPPVPCDDASAPSLALASDARRLRSQPAAGGTSAYPPIAGVVPRRGNRRDGPTAEMATLSDPSAISVTFIASCQRDVPNSCEFNGSVRCPRRASNRNLRQ